MAFGNDVSLIVILCRVKGMHVEAQKSFDKFIRLKVFYIPYLRSSFKFVKTLIKQSCINQNLSELSDFIKKTAINKLCMKLL